MNVETYAGIQKLVDRVNLYKEIDELTYQNSKVLLQILTKVMWDNNKAYDDLYYEYEEEYNMSDLEGVHILSEMGLENKAEELMGRLTNIAENRIITEIIERSIMKLRDYPRDGELYFDIINKKYLVKYKYTEREIIESMDISRTTYYRKRKEAINMFGVCLWKCVLPDFAQQIKRVN